MVTQAQKPATTSVGLDMLSSVQGASRYARSYAFLYAAFQQKGATEYSVRDALDCLIPFVAAYTFSISGHQVDLQKMQAFITKNFGFDFPIYTLERLLPDLQKMGYVEYKQGIKIWVALSKEDSFKVAQEEIDTDFEEIKALLETHATSIGFNVNPPSGDWGQALINFLKPDAPITPRVIVKIKEVVVDSRESERKIVAGFIQKLWETQEQRFDKLTKIFMGILVEDFLSGLSDTGTIDPKDPLIILGLA